MVYVISDLHGYPLEELKKLLNKAEFSSEDELYILGDVIDRNGDGGIEMLQWIMQEENVYFVLGNHEAMLLACDFVFEEITEESIKELDEEKFELLLNYQLDGGDVTLSTLKKLNNTSKSEVVKILDFLRKSPVYREITIDGKEFVLVHGGIDEFDEKKKLSDYTPDAFLFAWPELTDVYFKDKTVVFGHTPTRSYGNEFHEKPIRTDTWIAIDMGAADGKTQPLLLRLNDLEQFKN